MYGKEYETPRINAHTEVGHFGVFAENFQKVAVRLNGKVKYTSQNQELWKRLETLTYCVVVFRALHNIQPGDERSVDYDN